MDVAMKMPDLATVGSTVKVVRWLVEPGQPVRRGEPLLEVETDKATLIVESAVTGTLKSISARPEEVVPVGGPIATFDAEEAAPAPVLARPEAGPASPAAPIRPAPPPGKTGSFFARNRQAAREDET